jgi:c-di-GMP-binding flagellar brake protein YcgR
MSPTQQFTDRRRDQILEQVVVRGVHAVLSHHAATGWRTYKAAFVTGSRMSNMLSVRLFGPQIAAAELFPAPGDRMGVTFRLNHRKCVFNTLVESLQSDPDRIVLCLRWPDHLQQLQRRSFERVEVPRGRVIAVRFWQETPDATNRDVRHGQLENLSAGGMRIRISRDFDVRIGDAYKCVFAPRPGAPSMILDTRVQHKESVDEGRASVGLQFLGLEATAEGQRTLDRLARIVHQFQRANFMASRHRP